MATTNPKNGVDINGKDYGAGPHYYLHECLVSAGGANPPVVPAINDPNNPPCAAEVVSITRTGTGVNVVTLADNYYAVAYAGADVDDSAGDGAYANVGNLTNLQTGTPFQFTLRTYTAGGTPTDLAAGRRITLYFCFKKDFTGSAA